MSRGRWAMLALAALLAATVGCSSVPPASSARDEVELDQVPTADLEVLVASIDPPVARPGPELRLAQTELARSADGPLKGFVAIALTGDQAAPEALIRALGQPGLCEAAAPALAFLPRRLAPRPLWLALRLECSAAAARAAAVALQLDSLVTVAGAAGELAPSATTPPESPETTTCQAATEAIRDLVPDEPVPDVLRGLESSGWSFPTTESDLCAAEVLAAAVRLKRGDRAVSLALDLALDDPGEIRRALLLFIVRYDLGGASPRISERVGDVDGLICAALIRAGLLESVLPHLTGHPEGVPRCLVAAARALSDRDDEAARAALDAIAHTGMQPGCGAGALVAVIELADRGVRPPRWTDDPVFLGRALAARLTDGGGRLRPGLLRRLPRLRAAVERLRPRDDPPPQEGPVRLYQRDVRAVLPSASGTTRAALERLLAEGTR